MKKICIFLALCMVLNFSASAEQLEHAKIIKVNEYEYFNIAITADEQKYMTDSENNILHGPFAIYQTDKAHNWFWCERADKSQVLFDGKLNVLAQVSSEGSICLPDNGIYGVSQTSKNGSKIRDFQLFDLETNELLSTPGYFVYYYLEEQSDRLRIKKDGKYAIINKYGEYLTDFVFDEIKRTFRFIENNPFPYMIVVVDGEEIYLDWDLNVIDLDNYNGGHFVTWKKTMTYKGEETKFIYLESGNKSAVYNGETGKLIIPFSDEYSIDSYSYSDGVNVKVENKDGKVALFDENGNMMLDFAYTGIVFTAIPEIVILYDENKVAKYYNLVRREYIPDFEGVIADDGLIILSKYKKQQIVGAPVMGDKYTEMVPVSSRILNFAGHDVMGREYKPLICVDSVFLEDTNNDREYDTPVDVNRDFAIISLNGAYLEFDGVIVNDRTLVPVREITEGFGGEVLWDEITNTATLNIDGKSIEITIGVNEMLVDGQSIELDVPAQLINNKTMIPLRKLSETLGANVEWDEHLKCVYIER